MSSLLYFILAIAPLIFIHEMGHYLVGRLFGVKAEVFSIGFGRAIAHWHDKQGTMWKVGWMPLGGYVRFAGDMSPASTPSDEWLSLPAADRNRTFQSKKLWQRALIVLAGPMANFLFAIVAFGTLLSIYGEPRLDPVVAAVAKGSAAEAAGLRAGDRIVSVDGSAIGSFDDIAIIVQVHAGDAIPIGIVRDGRPMTVIATPTLDIQRNRFGRETRHGLLGVAAPRPTMVPLRAYEIPGAAVRVTTNVLTMQIKGLSQIVTGQRSVREMSGPVGTAQVAGEAASLGWLNFLFFMAFVSINLGFINLLPIPMLDGGHLFFYAIEAVRRRSADLAFQQAAFRIGFAALIALMLFVTFNDLAGIHLFDRLRG